MSFESRDELVHLLQTEGPERALEILDERIAEASLHEAGSPDATRTLAAKASLLYLLDRDEEAADLWAQVARQWAELHGADSSEALGARTEWILATAFSGELDAALVESSTLLHDIERAFGPDSPTAFRVREIRVRLTADLDRHPQALELAEDLRERRIAALGPLHPDSIRSHRMTAGIAAAQGDYERALEGYRAALIALEQSEGPLAESTLDTREDVAFLLGMLERFDDSEIAYTDLLDVLAEHPNGELLATVLRRRLALFERGEEELGLPASTVDEAYTDALSRLEAAPDAENAVILALRERWAARLSQSNRHAPALYQFRLLDDELARTGEPDSVLAIRGAIALSLRELGALDEAIEVLRAALNLAEASSSARESLAIQLSQDLTARGLHEESIALLQGFPFGEGSILNALAVAHIQAGQYAEAEAVLEPLQDAATEHPTATDLRILGNLGVVACELGRHSLARDRWIRLLEIEVANIPVTGTSRRQEIANADPDILRTRFNLARERWHLGEIRRALHELDDVIECRDAVLGEDHPDALAARSLRALITRQSGDLREAATRYRALLEDRSRILGADHPRTLLTARALSEIEGDLA
ncbi:hypothetical protein D9V32_11110 [Mycetocola tolaasinivorans]|uniref:Tetratricopeptide repeat protein n=1 Tax=Mycetocola tolaasinivorans TaxID=76635 RepID=A0A3L7A3Q7_9MICO|nr:tetratricopeptide repeat protein [Mycetocola tolaasinivorans]RLP74973.1 hypothetical protein D9V32_11110 [Mycetocola tolaasinivorans]